MTINKITTPAPDSELTLRVDDGTTHSTDTTLWIDLGPGYTFGNLSRTASVPTQAFELVMAIAASANADAGHTVGIKVLLTNAEDASNPGQGDTGSLVATETLYTFAGSASANDYVGRYVWGFDNIVEVAGGGAAPTACRFVGVQVDFATGATMKWGAYVVPKGMTGIN